MKCPNCGGRRFMVSIDAYQVVEFDINGGRVYNEGQDSDSGIEYAGIRQGTDYYCVNCAEEITPIIHEYHVEVE